MQKKIIISYLLIFVTLLAVMSLSRSSSEKIRGESIAIIAPFWEKLAQLNDYLSKPTEEEVAHQINDDQVKKLELENQLLKNEIGYLHNLSNYQEEIHLRVNSPDNRVEPVPARVLMRSFDTWNSSLWINVGAENNKDYPKVMIAKNSPVVVGKAVVGVIDYIDKYQSRVRLLTDVGLNPSVRAVRGGEQDLFMKEQIESVQNWLKRKKLSKLTSEDKERLSVLLNEASESLFPTKKSWYLAKGELQGSIKPTSRGFHPLLKGIGFNYDFSDEEGEGRDLRTGKPLKGEGDAVPLLKVNDLLVTTGMDGVFPPGLNVAVVTKIDLLKEGDYFYELEAKPVVSNLYELDLVFVIPPQG